MPSRFIKYCSRLLCGLLVSVLLPGALTANGLGPEGVWIREDGAGSVRIERCGGSLCGRITWLRDAAGPGHVGDRVFFDMNPAGADRWSGSAHNPDDGRDYDGTMVLSGQRLVTKGCALAGIICKTVYFIRQR